MIRSSQEVHKVNNRKSIHGIFVIFALFCSLEARAFDTIKAAQAELIAKQPLMALANCRKASLSTDYARDPAIQSKIQNLFVRSFTDAGLPELAKKYKASNWDEIQQFVKNYNELSQQTFNNWKIKRVKDGFELSPPGLPSEIPVVNSHDLFNQAPLNLPPRTKSTPKDPLALMHAQQDVEQIRERYKHVPLTLNSKSPMFAELKRASNLELNQEKKVDFDLNPFLPDAWRITEL